MPLQLPNLDDRRYADLVAEARRLIPALDPQWTNHNPSDPGIALIELFAYHAEMLLYRLDRVTLDSQRKFLKLLNGPDWKPSADLNADIRNMALSLRTRDRAVTAEDFEHLAKTGFNDWLHAQRQIEADQGSLNDWYRITGLDSKSMDNRPSGIHEVARAACVPSRNLERGTDAERIAVAPGHVSVVIVPQDRGTNEDQELNSNPLQPSDLLKAALTGYLEERRILTTRHHVVGPYYAPVEAEILVACRAGTRAEDVKNRIVKRLQALLDCFPDTAGVLPGWPFGRDVYVSEFYEQVEAVEGVDYISDLMLFGTCKAEDVRSIAAPALWHPEGDLIGLSLAAHQLPLARFDAAKVVVLPAQNFVPVELVVTSAAAGVEFEPALVKRNLKTRIREFFRPPIVLEPLDIDGGINRPGVSIAKLRAALQSAAGVNLFLEVRAPDSRLLSLNGERIGLRVEKDEAVDWRVEFQGI